MKMAIKATASSIVVSFFSCSKDGLSISLKCDPKALRDYGPELCRLLLRDGTHYFICGDAKVGDNCYEVCIQVLRIYGNMSKVGGVTHINRMRVENRWQFDRWGVINFVEAKRQIKKEKERRAANWLKSFE